MPPKRVSSKAEAGRARKEEAAGQKVAKAAAAREVEVGKDWQRGANEKGQARSDDAASRADEAARKRQEKAALLAEEEAALGPGGKVKVPKMTSKKNAKKKDDLSFLTDALVGAAEKKKKQKKLAEEEKKRLEAQAAKERAEREQEVIDPLMQNTNMMLEGAVGRQANLQNMEAASGLDGALQTLNVSVSGTEVKSQKALYMAFEERTLLIVKQEYPGLRLSQYKEKIFALWKKSPDNPQNQQQEG